MLPKINTYVKTIDDKTKLISFAIEDDKLLRQCDNSWNKVRHSRNNSLMAKSSAIKTKIKSYHHDAID